MAVTSGGEYCDRCKKRNPIAFHVEPAEAQKIVVLKRWKKLCPACFDLLAEQKWKASGLVKAARIELSCPRGHRIPLGDMPPPL